MLKITTKRNAGVIFLLCRQLFFLLMTLSTFSGILLANASEAQDLKNTIVSLNLQGAAVTTLFREIEEQTPFTFSYRQEDLRNVSAVTVQVKEKTLDKVLETISRQTGLAFKQLNNMISVHRAMPAESQGRKVSGKVTDAMTGELLSGASVMVKGTLTGAITDAEGLYTIELPEAHDVLVFSFMGYQPLTVAVEGRDVIDISLQPDIRQLQDIVVIGYGTQQRDQLTGSIAQVRSKDMVDMPIASFEQGIAGLLPGVQVLQTSGAPGSGITVQVRGIGTITAGSQPLYVIDNFPVSNNNSSFLNPDDIESIEILKDAAASAIYGSRGSNGVVLITTKKGKGTPVLSFKTYQGVQQVSHMIEMADAYQNAELTAAARNNFWIDANPGVNKASDPNSIRDGGKYQVPPFLFPYLEGQKGLTNTNWQKEIYRQAPMRNYELSASGDVNGFKYYVSGNYYDQEGIIINSGFRRYTFRTNIEMPLSSKVKAGFNFTPSFSTYDLISEKSYKNDGIVLSALMALPHFPVYNPDGSFAISDHIKYGQYSTTWVENPVALASLIDRKFEKLYLLGGAYLNINLAEGLTFRTYLGGDFNASRGSYFRPSTLGTYRSVAPSVPEATENTSRTYNYLSENTLSYSKDIADVHHFTVLAGYTVQKENIQTSYAYATNFPNDRVPTLNAGQVTDGDSSEEEWALISYLSRVSYDFRNKYLISISVRRDGSSRFGESSKWGWFPAASAGYRISEEAFFPSDIIVSDLKIRGSYGKTGNNLIPNYGSIALLEPANYVFGGSLINGLRPLTSPNANLSWEKTGMVDIGVDMGLLEDRVYLTADIYRSVTSGLLLDVPVPGSSGHSTSLQNLGKVENKGLELGLRITHSVGPVSFGSMLNFSANRNKVLALGPGQDRMLTDYHVTQVGKPMGSYYGYKVLGVFENQGQLDQYPHLPQSEVGSYRYEDVNPDNQINDKDRTIIGDFFPDFLFGFTGNVTYKNFDLNFSIQGVQGVEIFNLARAFTSATQGWSNTTREVYENHFRSPEEPGNGISKPLTTPTDKLHEQSDFMVEDGSYIRMKNIALGYNLPSGVLKKTFAKQVRIYVSSRNPFTLTRYSGYNPEVSTWNDQVITPGVDYGAYPIEKTWIVGLNINF